MNYIDLSIDHSEREVGSIIMPRPDLGNYSALGFALHAICPRRPGAQLKVVEPRLARGMIAREETAREIAIHTKSTAANCSAMAGILPRKWSAVRSGQVARSENGS
jgi:hypothetical protein